MQSVLEKENTLERQTVARQNGNGHHGDHCVRGGLARGGGDEGMSGRAAPENK